VRVGDELVRRADLEVPPQLLPVPLRELLLPRPWRERVDAVAAQHRLQPAQLWALMRAGSGFDPRALSPWGGRGLLLVDASDGERLAGAAGLAAVRPEDLFEPGVNIAVGAARLAELEAALTAPHQPLLAHLSDPQQARLWTSWCATDDPAELLTKVGAEEVRTTAVQVLSAQAAYAELYPAGS
jgi:soluble lytic murein transglycosylase